MLSIHPSPSVSRGSGPDLNILTDAKPWGIEQGGTSPGVSHWLRMTAGWDWG